MICVGIDVAKDKHDCFILNEYSSDLSEVFTIPNNMEGGVRYFAGQDSGLLHAPGQHKSRA